MDRIQKILVPVDFSERSANGLQYAASLAQGTKAELIVMHVFEKNEENSFIDSLAAFEGWPIPPKGLTRIPVDRLLRERSLDLYNFIQKAVGKQGTLRIRRMVAMGNPVKEILGVAKEERIDLIVLALRKKSLFSYLMARGALLKMVWRFPCPVLLTPPISNRWSEPAQPLVSWQI